LLLLLGLRHTQRGYFYMLSEYKTRVANYDKASLESEMTALKDLLRKLFQEYNDRAETLCLVSNQIEIVRNRLSEYEEQTL